MTSQKLSQQVGLAIRQLRHKRGISQAVLARRALLARSYVASVEAGKRNLTLRTLVRFAVSLDVPVAALFLVVPDTERCDEM